MPYISWSLVPPTQPAFGHAPPTRSLGVMTYVVLAERSGQRAGRLESRTIGTVDADTVETARLMATQRWPGLTLSIRDSDGRAP